MLISEIINLDKYPINNPASVHGELLIESVRAKLAEDGCCTLESFITSKALGVMADQAHSISNLSYPGPMSVSPYFFNYNLGQDLETDEFHPLKRRGKRNLSQVAADLIPAEHLLRFLYESQIMLDFLSQVREVPIYCNQDKYQSLNISVMEPGGCQQWHFDSGNLVTTLLLQSPDSGGEFEYVPDIRSDQAENFEAVRKVLDGERSRVKSIQLEPGTLSLFKGHYSLHRVTEVGGETRRIQAILGYTTVPNLVGSLESSILHYGPRVAELESA